MREPPQTLTEKVLLRRQTGAVVPESAYRRIPVDLVLGHEATIALLIERLRRTGRRVWDPSRCFFAADHFVPPSTPERAEILELYVSFLREQGISLDLLYRGISHQLLVENGLCLPGMVICGADSHTVMAGALGCVAVGLGSTDILAVLLTGETFLTIPPSIRVCFTGDLPAWPVGKDLALEIIRRLGEGGAIDHALEYHDHTSPGISMESRFAIANMSVEAGAANGIFVPDDALREYLVRRDGALRIPEDSGETGAWLKPDPDAHYVRELEIDAGKIEPLVALPGGLNEIAAISEVEPVEVQQVFVGSCAGGRAEDLATVARLLKGKRVAPGVQLVVTPASMKVYHDCLRNGVLADLASAGALITNSSCGACGGIDKGLIGPKTNCLSTSNRNFRGRMGSPEGKIYLASAATAAAAALMGKLADPRPFLGEMAA
jgi:3-isopropylmalate/(R)-2-methylmalate dehydratase large subunit